MQGKVRRGGEIELPDEVREHLGVKPGSFLVFSQKGQSIVIRVFHVRRTLKRIPRRPLEVCVPRGAQDDSPEN